MANFTAQAITACSALVAVSLSASALLKAQAGRFHTAVLRGGIAAYILFLTSEALLHG